MYTIPSIYGAEDDVTGSEAVYVVDPIYCNLDNMSSSLNPLQSLSCRMRAVTSNLKSLSDAIDVLATTYNNVDTTYASVNANANAIANVSIKHTSLVIRIPSYTLPVTALMVYAHLAGAGQVFATAHEHSSLTSILLKELLNALTTSESNETPISSPKTRITFIFTGDVEETELVQNASIDAPLIGSNNVARYLCRIHDSVLYEGPNDDMNRAVLVDHELAAVEAFGSLPKKERTMELRRINQMLNGRKWLIDGDSSYSLADLAWWGVLPRSDQKNRDAYKQGSIAAWAAELEALPEFKFLLGSEEPVTISNEQTNGDSSTSTTTACVIS